MPLENPAVKLSPIVSTLFELAGDTRLPQGKRNTIYLKASRLRGYLVTLVSKQFEKESEAYDAATEAIAKVNTDLKAAQKDIQKIVSAVSDIAALVGAVEKLVKTIAPMLV